MKGKPGQECSLGIETKVRIGPERKGDKVITPCWEEWWCWLCFASAVPACQTCVPHQPLQRRKTNQRSAVHPHPSHSLSPPLCIAPTSPHKWDALQCCTLRQPPATVYSPARQEYAGRICYIIRSRQEVRLNCSSGYWIRGLVSHQGDEEYARTYRYAGNVDRKYLSAEICKQRLTLKTCYFRCDVLINSLQNCVMGIGKSISLYLYGAKS